MMREVVSAYVDKTTNEKWELVEFSDRILYTRWLNYYRAAGADHAHCAVPFTAEAEIWLAECLLTALIKEAEK